MIALLLAVVTVLLYVGRREYAEILAALWARYKNWAGVKPQGSLFEGPRYQSTVRPEQKEAQ